MESDDAIRPAATAPPVAVAAAPGDAAGDPGRTASSAGPDPDHVRELLHAVIDPEIGLDIVNLGLLRSVTVDGGDVAVEFTVTTPACPLSHYIENEIRQCLFRLPGLTSLSVECVLQPPWNTGDMSEMARAALGFD